MKNKHTHPVSDALNRLDEDTVSACMSEDVTPRAAVSHRGLYRKLAVAAACLTLTAAVGVTAFLPLMRADDPTLPETNMTVSEDSTSSVEDKEEKYPFVKLQVLSFSENDTEETMPDGESSVTLIDEFSLLRAYHLYLHFDCAEGETVTILTHDIGENDDISEEWQSTLALVEVSDHRYDNPADYVARILTREIRNRLNNKSHNLLKLGNTTYMWCYPNRETEKNYDVVNFVIRNENDEITGAGSVCIGTLTRHYTNQLRYEVLGSVRFDTPVSEETAASYLAALEATAEDIYADMDFTPQIEDEGFALAYSAVSALPNTNHIGCYTNSNCSFRWFTGYQIGSPYTEEREAARRFFLFSDGTYAEVAPEGFDAYDGMLESLSASSDEADFSALAIPLTDGRVITFREETFTEPADGKEVTAVTRNKWVAVIIDPSSEPV